MAITNSIPRQYDPKSVILTLGGVTPVDYAPDTMITISKDEDRVMPSVGVKGEVALARNRNELGTLTLALKQTSPTNESLLDWYLVEEGGIFFFPVYFEDPSSGIRLVSSGWVQTQPDFAVGKEIAMLDWTIGIANVAWERIPGSTSIIDIIKEGTVL
jgi:hypothetical protein